MRNLLLIQEWKTKTSGQLLKHRSPFSSWAWTVMMKHSSFVPKFHQANDMETPWSWKWSVLSITHPDRAQEEHRPWWEWHWHGSMGATGSPMHTGKSPGASRSPASWQGPCAEGDLPDMLLHGARWACKTGGPLTHTCSGEMQPMLWMVHLGPEIQNLALKFIKYKNLEKVLDFSVM